MYVTTRGEHPSTDPSESLSSPAESAVIQQAFVEPMFYEQDCIIGLKET